MATAELDSEIQKRRFAIYRAERTRAGDGESHLSQRVHGQGAGRVAAGADCRKGSPGAAGAAARDERPGCARLSGCGSPQANGQTLWVRRSITAIETAYCPTLCCSLSLLDAAVHLRVDRRHLSLIDEAVLVGVHLVPVREQQSAPYGHALRTWRPCRRCSCPSCPACAILELGLVGVLAVRDRLVIPAEAERCVLHLFHDCSPHFTSIVASGFAGLFFELSYM